MVTADHDHAIAFNAIPRSATPSWARSSLCGWQARAGRRRQALHHAGVRQRRSPNADADSKTNPEDGNKAWIAPARARDDLSNVNTDDNFLQEVGVVAGQAGAETHGGGDVMLFAGGAGAKIFKGTMDNTKVFGKVRRRPL